LIDAAPHTVVGADEQAALGVKGQAGDGWGEGAAQATEAAAALDEVVPVDAFADVRILVTGLGGRRIVEVALEEALGGLVDVVAVVADSAVKEEVGVAHVAGVDANEGVLRRTGRGKAVGAADV